LVTVIGWDIGGANTKAVFLRTENGCVKEIRMAIEYFPIWKKGKQLPEVFRRLKNRVAGTYGKQKVLFIGLKEFFMLNMPNIILRYGF